MDPSRPVSPAAPAENVITSRYNPLFLLWRALVRLFTRAGRSTPIVDAASLREFLQTRASYVSQMSLYGYLRTRAGTRFPELFTNDQFVVSINIAKWHVWLACLSDLTVHTGGLLAHRSHATAAEVGALMQTALDDILMETGTPKDAGPLFLDHAARIRSRIALCDWLAQTDDDRAFVESAPALVEWAPIVDELKQHDAEIVTNSIRFRWQEVRRDLRRDLDAARVLAAARAAEAGTSEKA